jgi:hypothetical protein
LLVIADLLAAHWRDVPTVLPSYWTTPPVTVEKLKSDPGFIRVFGQADKSAGEPGYASEPVDFRGVRDPLDWSLPLVWHVPTSKGNTPMHPRRLFDFGDPLGAHRSFPWRFDLEGDTHFLVGRTMENARGEPIGTALLRRNPGALPRARIVGRPVYAANQRQALSALMSQGNQLRDRLVVEDPSRPLPSSALTSGTARIVEDLPERVVIEANLQKAGYLVLADTFDPGWSATVDGEPAAIRPAYVAFRAVYLKGGPHTVVFTYRPAGFTLGLTITVSGLVLGLVFCLRPRRRVALAPDHATLAWFSHWRMLWFLSLAAIVLASTVSVSPAKKLTLQKRWKDSVHTFTWGSGEAAMKRNRR